jgi:branched-chain amino acid transport system ATP-binding protein
LTAAAAHEHPPAGDRLLAVRGVSKRFGALHVLDDVTLEVRSGEAIGIVGPNGAGKTTLLDLIAGATRADAGAVQLDGRDLGSLRAAARCRLGMGRTHQIPRPFGGMTAFENVFVAATMGSRRRESSRSATAERTRSACSIASGSSSRGHWRPRPGCCCSTRSRAG